MRYEVACGPPAVFGPAGTPSIEVPTNEAGQASVEIVQKDPSPGTNQVRVQVFRPADSCGERLKVREGSVLVTWTAPSLGIRQMGPPTAVVGETITYRIEVSNPGDLPARDVVASEEVPDGLSFLQANPIAGGRGPPVAMATGRPGPAATADHRSDFSHHATRGRGPLRRSHRRRRAAIEPLCEHERPGRAARPGHDTRRRPRYPARARYRLQGPARLGPVPRRPTPRSWISRSAAEAQAVVGSDLTFDIDLTNRGPVPATGIVIRDTFGDGLEHQERSPIAGFPRDLAPGQSAQIWRHLPRHQAGTTLSPRGSHRRRWQSAQSRIPALRQSCRPAARGRQRPHHPAQRPLPRRRQPQRPCRCRSASPARPRQRLANRSSLRPRSPTLASSRLPTWSSASSPTPRWPLARRTEGAEKEGNDVVWSLPSVPPGSRSGSRCNATASNRRPRPVAVLP